MARWQIDPRVTARARNRLREEFGITQTRATTALAHAARAIRRERHAQAEVDHD